MRQITSQFVIGSSRDAQQDGDKYDRVIALATPTETATHIIQLPDGEHEYGRFVKAVEAVREGLQSSDSVLLHCQAGSSRSVAVAIAAIVTESGWRFDEAYEACRSHWTCPDAALMESAEHYIEETSSRHQKTA